MDGVGCGPLDWSSPMSTNVRGVDHWTRLTESSPMSTNVRGVAWMAWGVDHWTRLTKSSPMSTNVRGVAWMVWVWTIGLGSLRALQ